MRFARVFRHRLRTLFRRRYVEEELARELELHLEQLAREQRASGLSAADAQLAARRQFGSLSVAQELCRQTRRLGLLEDLARDVVHAARLLARSPAFAVTAVLSLALGIGANTAIYSLVDTVLLRSLPVERPQELTFLTAVGTEGPSGAPPYPYFERLRHQSSSFSGMAAFASDDLAVQVDGTLEQVFGQVASGSYFEVLGLQPAAGRLMTTGDERLDPPVAVVGAGYAQRRFGGAAGAVGKTVKFGNRVYTIIGVTPAGFSGLQPGRQIDITFPITHERRRLADGGAWWFEAIARLRPGADPVQAALEADTLFQAFMNDRQQTGELRRKYFDHIELPSAARGLDRLRTRFSRSLYLLWSIAAMVLLIACANLSHLLLARGAARSREMAIRLATGAGVGRLVRQLLTETLLLFLVGAAAGLLIAVAALQGFTSFFAIGRNPILLDARFDWRLALFAGAVALLCGLLTGLWPALRALRAGAHSSMQDGGARLTGSRHSRSAAGLLIGAQVALSLTLLVIGVLFAKTMRNLRTADLGFTAGRVLTMSLDPMISGDRAAPAREQFWSRVLERVRTMPGVRAASLSVLTPLSGRDTVKLVTVPGFQPRGETDRMIRVNHVSAEYFQTFGIAILAGRAFTARDVRPAQNVVVLNQAAANAYFAGRDPIGETVLFGESGAYSVVGVVRDHKHTSVREPAPRFAYVPLWQPLDSHSRVTLAISSGQPQPALARTVTGEIRAIRAQTLVSDVLSVQEQIDATVVNERLLSTLSTGFSALALLLSAVGLYGVLSYAVARRRAEFGVRMALGALPRHIAWHVVRSVLGAVVPAMAAGLLVAWVAARAAGTLLFGISPVDRDSYLVASAVLLATACLAAWIPARRAVSISPTEALRRM